MSRHSALAACCLTAVLAVAGCGGNDSSSPSSPTRSTTSKPSPTKTTTPSVTVTSPTSSSESSSPAGERLRGGGYSVTIPAGWEDITAAVAAKNPHVDIAMGESNPSGFRTNFNVVDDGSSNVGSLQDNEAAIRKEAARELATITHAKVTPLPDRTVDGEPAIGQTSTFTTSGTSVTFLQYFTVHDGKAYPLTMTFATDNRATATRLLDQILASWQWS